LTWRRPCWISPSPLRRSPRPRLPGRESAATAPKTTVEIPEDTPSGSTAPPLTQQPTVLEGSPEAVPEDAPEEGPTGIPTIAELPPEEAPREGLGWMQGKAGTPKSPGTVSPRPPRSRTCGRRHGDVSPRLLPDSSLSSHTRIFLGTSPSAPSTFPGTSLRIRPGGSLGAVLKDYITSCVFGSCTHYFSGVGDPVCPIDFALGSPRTSRQNSPVALLSFSQPNCITQKACACMSFSNPDSFCLRFTPYRFFEQPTK